MEAKRAKNRISLRLALLGMCFLFLGDVLPVYAAASDKTLTVEVAKEMALAQSSEYAGLQNKLSLAKMQYTQAIKSIKLKEKNQRTFRWSPLLNFKFPEKTDLSDQMEYTYKPLELQSEIDTLNHSITDCVYGIYEETQLCFVEVYVLQEKISFYEARILSYQTALEKNRIRLLSGLASQSDIDAMEKKLETLNSTLASDKRSFASAKEKLGGILGIDVSTSYAFASPFVDVELDREAEELLIAYTLEHDDAFYQTQTATANGLLALETNYSLLQKQYGSSKLSLISSFVTQAKQGEKLDAAAFKMKYEEFLEAVDSPWQGKKKILFIKIPKEWFKGSVDGIRYVEDEPYVLYEAALEYQSLYAEEQAQKTELTNSVKTSFDNYVSTRNSSQELEKEVQKKAEELERARLLNAAGQMSLEEYEQVREEYEELQMDSLEAQAAYSQVLYSFDRLTCGAISAYLKGELTGLTAAEGGQSYVVEDEGEGVYYFIHSLVEDNLFEIGLSVPEDFEPSFTAYELWVDNVQIGERVEADKTIRHLALDVQSVERVFLRLYDGDTFVDDCEIDAGEYSGKLTIRTYRVETAADTLLGEYSVSLDGETGLFQLSIQMKPGQTAAFYNIRTETGDYLVSSRKLGIRESFTYLAAAENSLEELVLCLYDEAGSLLCTAWFDGRDRTIRKLD